MKFQKTIKNIKTKKGNLLDIPNTVMAIFGVVFVLFIIMTFLNEFSTNIASNPSTNYTVVTENLDSHKEKLNSSSDYGVLFLAIMFTVGGYILAKFIPSDPSFLIVTYLIMGVFLLLSFIFSNIYGSMQDNSTFLAFTANTKYIAFLLPKLPYLSIIQIFLFSLGLYNKDE